MTFYNKYALLNAHKDEDIAENCILFSVYYETLTSNNSINPNIISYIERCRRGPGLFDNRPFRNGSKEDYMSHDNLTAIMCYSYVHGLCYHKEIWSEIKSQYFKYDNLEPNEPKRYLHPRDLIFYGYLNGSLICKFLLIFLHIIQFVSCYQQYKVRYGVKYKKTDGKLLTWLRLTSTKQSFIIQLLEKVLKFRGFESFKNCFKIYFKDKNHPIRRIIGE